MSQAIINILSEYFGLDVQTNKIHSSNNLLVEEIELLKQKIMHLEQLHNQTEKDLLNRILALEQKTFESFSAAQNSSHSQSKKNGSNHKQLGILDFVDGKI